MHISLVWQVLVNSTMILDLLHDIFHVQVFVLRNIQMLHLVTRYTNGVLISLEFTYYFFFPDTRSLRKYMVIVGQLSRYACTSTVKNRIFF